MPQPNWSGSSRCLLRILCLTLPDCQCCRLYGTTNRSLNSPTLPAVASTSGVEGLEPRPCEVYIALGLVESESQEPVYSGIPSDFDLSIINQPGNHILNKGRYKPLPPPPPTPPLLPSLWMRSSQNRSHIRSGPMSRKYGSGVPS